MQAGQGGPPPGGYGAPPGGQQQPYGYHQPRQGQQQPHGGQGQMSPYQPYSGQCPRCQSFHLSKPSFTWWGGLIGPKILNHTVCGACTFGFNAKTGKSNSTAIGIYLGVGVVLGILLVALRLAV